MAYNNPDLAFDLALRAQSTDPTSSQLNLNLATLQLADTLYGEA